MQKISNDTLEIIPYHFCSISKPISKPKKNGIWALFCLLKHTMDEWRLWLLLLAMGSFMKEQIKTSDLIRLVCRFKNNILILMPLKKDNSLNKKIILF